MPSAYSSASEDEDDDGRTKDTAREKRQKVLYKRYEEEKELVTEHDQWIQNQEKNAAGNKS